MHYVLFLFLNSFMYIYNIILTHFFFSFSFTYSFIHIPVMSEIPSANLI